MSENMLTFDFGDEEVQIPAGAEFRCLDCKETMEARFLLAACYYDKPPYIPRCNRCSSTRLEVCCAYEVKVVRWSKESTTIRVKAFNREEAAKKAEDMAGDEGLNWADGEAGFKAKDATQVYVEPEKVAKTLRCKVEESKGETE